ELAVKESECRAEANQRFREKLLAGLGPLQPVLTGDPERTVPHIVNLSIPGVDAEEAMEALAGVVAISNGSACTLQSLTCSHVLGAMRLDEPRARGALRFSWCHLTGEVDWARVVEVLKGCR